MLFRMVRKTLGCLFFLLVVLPLLLLGLGVATIHVATMLIEDKIEERTGFKVDFDDVDLNFITGKLQLNGTKIENPRGFPQVLFLKIREVTLDFDLLSLLRDRKVIEEMVVDIDLLNYVRNTDSRLNLRQFLGAIGVAIGELAQLAGSEGDFRYLIERCQVRLQEVNYVDLSRPNSRDRHFMPNFRFELEEITDFQQIVVALARELKGIGLGILADPLKDSLVDIKSLEDLAARLQEDSSEDGEGDEKTLVEKVQDVGEAIQNVIDSFNEK